MNLNLIQSLSALSGLITDGTVLFIAIIGSFFLVKSGIGKTVSKANQEAITALQATIIALQADLSTMSRKIEEEIKRNARLDQTIDTICAALKIRGMVITIQGEMIHVEDRNGKTTTTRIHEKEDHS
jgi:hypothetical protein